MTQGPHKPTAAELEAFWNDVLEGEGLGVIGDLGLESIEALADDEDPVDEPLLDWNEVWN